MDSLEEARACIDSIDREIARLFEERMNQSAKVADYKIRHALPIYDAAKEASKLSKNAKLITDPVIREYYISFQKSVMYESRAYQGRIMHGMKVSYCGAPGAFAYIAAHKLFPDAELVGYPVFEDAYQACEQGLSDVCVLPVENSFAGDVGMVMDLIYSGPLSVNRMVDVEIVQNLIAVKGATMSDVRTVVSHPQALAQCAAFIRNNCLGQTEYPNTAIAAKYVAEKADKSIAAIASKETADLYGLDVLESHINTGSVNTTRFAALSALKNAPAAPGKKDGQFLLLFTVPNEAGALAKVLNIIGAHGFNMRNLRSRPQKNLSWSYYFFAELEGNVWSEDGQDLLRQLGTLCRDLKLAGTYSAEE